jgi:hypothetical protein
MITENKTVELKYSEVRAGLHGLHRAIRCSCGINYTLPMVGVGDIGKVYGFVCTASGKNLLSYGCGKVYSVKIDKL